VLEPLKLRVVVGNSITGLYEEMRRASDQPAQQEVAIELENARRLLKCMLISDRRVVDVALVVTIDAK
jgi:hypothetical protein